MARSKKKKNNGPKMIILSNVLTVEISIRRFTTYWSIAPNQVVSVIANLRVERPASTYSESKL